MKCMRISQLASVSYLVAATLFIAGCVGDAAHDNPLDPQSPRYTGTGAFSGKVTLLNLSGSGVASVHISTNPSTLSIITDSSGNFVFPEIASGTYDVIAAKDLFAPETLHVSIGTGGQQSIIFSLDGYPQVTSAKILTSKIDQWWPNPAYFATLTTVITDPNGISDLDSAWFCVDSILYPLNYSVTEKDFQLTLTSYQLPSNNLEWLVGKPLTVIARDREYSTSTSAPFYVTRTIEDEATPTYPVSQDTASASPLFLWNAPAVRFIYTYSLTVVRVDAGAEAVVWSQDNVGSHLLSYQYPSTLDQGSYFWTIAVVDEYGNSARSKEASFVVN
jgi:hypothetical protein